MESIRRLFLDPSIRSLRVTCDTRRFGSEAAAVHHQDECDDTKDDISGNDIYRVQYVQLVQYQQRPAHREGEDGPPFRVAAAIGVYDHIVCHHTFFSCELASEHRHANAIHSMIDA